MKYEIEIFMEIKNAKCILRKNNLLNSLNYFMLNVAGLKVHAPPGNRTRVARMGILHDTTTPAAPVDVAVAGET